MAPFELAISHYGVKEITGSQDNPTIIEWFDYMGFDGKKLKDETAWCSLFVNVCCKHTGYPFSGKLNARSWLNIGNQTSSPKTGDIVVFWRVSPNDWRGHVGFFVRETKNWVYVLGGNQNNQVNIKAYHKSRLLQYRELC